MEDADLFGVQDPRTGGLGYGSFMGVLGEHLALALYRGSEGLAGFWRLYEADFESPEEGIGLLLEIPSHARLRALVRQCRRGALPHRGRRAGLEVAMRCRSERLWFLLGAVAKPLDIKLVPVHSMGALDQARDFLFAALQK